MDEHSAAVKSLKIARPTTATLVLTAGDAESLPCRDGVFDRVACVGAAHHLLNPLAAFRKIFRVLAPDGTLVTVIRRRFVLVVADHELAGGCRDDSRRRLIIAHKEEFTPAHAVALLSEVGLQRFRHHCTTV
jgi:ubiquinone/menaquinone biosynthesis C-methylase UbiE